MGATHLAPKNGWSETEDKTLAGLIFVEEMESQIFEKNKKEWVFLII